MPKNPDILAKKQNLQFKRDRGLFICFLGREIHWYMLTFIKIARNPVFGPFGPKIAKLHTNWPNWAKIEKSIGMFQELLVSTKTTPLSLRIIIEVKTIPKYVIP